MLQSQRTTRMAEVLRQPSMFVKIRTMRSMRTFRSQQTNGGGSSKTATTRQQSLNSNGIYTDKQECGLCYETFKLVDEVFFCERMHVFHKLCYEERPEDEASDVDIEDESQ